MKVIPSILTNDPDEARELISRCEGVVDRVSIDIIDGKFAPNKTVSPEIFFDIDVNIKIDYQLMVMDPINWIEKCVRGNADRIIGHIEHMSDQSEFIKKVQEAARFSGLALDLSTPITALDELLLNNVDSVLVMSVPAGFGGQEFNPQALEKIKKLLEIREKLDASFVIQDDGGVTINIIDDTKDVGADEVSVGRKLFDGDLKENIEKFMKASYS